MMRLSEARLCLDCEVLFRGPFCPVCGSTKAPFVSRWLNRENLEEVREDEGRARRTREAA